MLVYFSFGIVCAILPRLSDDFGNVCVSSMAIVDDRYASYVPKLYSQVPYEIKRVPNKPKDKNKRQKTIKRRTMNYEKQANQLPKLGAQRVIFRDWQASLLAYLGKKHLSMYINYHVHPPQLVVKEPKHSEVAKEMIRKAKGSNPFNIAAVQHYTINFQ
eukprot:snap_masked-scaffold_1-processed-gene-15.30-mRNA-1 protein AED:1.00 eAED:1.00 QI:0/-1/0/0/-1/1/1/0/158